MRREPGDCLVIWRWATWALVVVAASSRLSLAEAGSLWPQFRGPDGQGRASERGLPLKWSEKDNVVWKTEVPGRGWSSPVVEDDRVWVTTAVDNTLRVLCLDRNSGDILQNIIVFQKEFLGRIYPENSHATPTPVLDGGRVYAHFGAHGTACLSEKGEILWTTQLKYYHHHGPASSPVVVDDLLIVACDGFPGPAYGFVLKGVKIHQFVAALDKLTGEVRWKRPRQDGWHSYATPLAMEVDGRVQVVSPGANRVVAYDPKTGQEIWWCRYKGYSVVPRPVFGAGLVYVCTGYDPPAALLAIRPDGRGDVTETHVAWRRREGVPLGPSPLLAGAELYLIDNGGVLSCLDAKTGSLHWRARVGRKVYASPLYADGRIYIIDTSGATTVLAPGTRLKKLAVNRLSREDHVFASMAVSGRSLFIRTRKNLFRIEDRSED